MCGIVGMISKQTSGFSWKDKQMFSNMLYADAIRGFDSTGVFSVNKYGNLKMIKAAQRADAFIQTKKYKDFEDDIFTDARIVVGHNRASTRGATNDQNAHPFIEKEICLIHNGTLTAHKHLADKEVDSHAICHSIANKGYEDTIPHVHGAFALIWYDAKIKKLFVGRNDERPLWVLQTKDTDFIASEPEMLIWLYRRNYAEKGALVPKYFDTKHLYIYNLDTLAGGYSTEDMPKKATPVSTFPQVGQAILAIGDHSTKVTDITNSKKVKIPYKPGDLITFEYTSSSVAGGYCTFKGNTIQGDFFDVTCTVKLDQYSKEEEEALVDDAEYLSGVYSGFSWVKGKCVLVLRDPKIADVYTSVDGILVTEQQIAQAGYACHDCGSILDLDVENYDFWVRMSATHEIKKVLCSHCVDRHPHIFKNTANKELHACMNAS